MSILSISAVPSPFTAPEVWDRVSISGMEWKGKVEFRRASRFYKWDTKDASGQEGAKQTYRGKRPEKFSLRIYLWTDAQWTDWTSNFLPLFFYNGVQGNVKPVTIYHPSLALIGLTEIIAHQIFAPEKISDDDIMFASDLELEEYFPPANNPTNATKTPSGAEDRDPGAPGNLPNPKIAALQAEIAAATHQAVSVGALSGLP